MKFRPICLLLLTTSISTPLFAKSQKPTPKNESYDWLEEVEGKKAIDWVKKQNNQTTSTLEKDKRYQTIVKNAENILNAKNKLALVRIRATGVINFWQDEEHVRGLVRQASLDSYAQKKEQWDTILDLDQLAKDEKENWVFKGSSCLEPEEKRCLLNLSKGGKDATVIREFDYSTKQFISDGFQLPEAKSTVEWLDQDTLIVGTDFGNGTMTSSGYPRILKVWKRGTPLTSATEIFAGETTDVSVHATNFYRDNQNFVFLMRRPDFFNAEYWYLKNNEKLKLAVPKDASLVDLVKGYLILELRQTWGNAKTGALVAVKLDDAIKVKSSTDLNPTVIFHPGERGSISSVDSTKNFLVVTYLDNIKGKALRIRPNAEETPDQWEKRAIDLPTTGTLGLLSAHQSTDNVFFSYEDFVTPESVYLTDLSTMKTSLNRQDVPRFDASNLMITQKEATSKDGTKIPYFVVHAKDMKRDGHNATILYGYGGFEVPELPQYMAVNGKSWLEKGGVWVSANIRGGGEFGPAWHQAAVKENRQKAFDDFIAVAEDLVNQKISSPQKLAIMGGSNGGLLVGATFVQRPDLFKAVVCQVPLLDMMRYHKLLAGSSWMAEYGDPEDPKMQPILAAYSPFQNVKANVKYPDVLFVTSTKDDRVHPGHARKMAAKMLAQGHKIRYFENIEGGHSASANLMQVAKRKGLEYTWLYQELGLK